MVMRSPLLHLDEARCLACLACASVCPEGVITVLDDDDRRYLTIRLGCPKDCRACVDVCPFKALEILFDHGTDSRSHAPLTWSVPLARCRTCGRGFSSERMIRTIEDTLLKDLDLPSDAIHWVRTCPDCRRREDAQHAVEGVRAGVD